MINPLTAKYPSYGKLKTIEELTQSTQRSHRDTQRRRYVFEYNKDINRAKFYPDNARMEEV